MEVWTELGLSLLARWRRVDLDVAAFPDLAAAALLEHRPDTRVTPMDVVRWVHTSATLPFQSDVPARFGSPPIDVWSCEELYIQVLFWVDGTTAVHQHAFAGAFQVLEGSSLHATHTFTETRRFGESVRLGALQHAGSELLTRGDVRPIRHGDGFVHSLFHLDRPSVSVVVRTPGLPSANPQLTYTRGGLAYDPFHEPQRVTKQLQTLDLLHALASPELEPLARESAANGDAFAAFKILRHARELLPHASYLAFLASVPEHEEIRLALARDAEAARREHHILRARRRVTDPELRFFLALLLNVPGRRRVLELVAEAFPEREPIAAVMAWVDKLRGLDDVRSWAADLAKARADDEARVLGAAVDDAWIASLRAALSGGSVDDGSPLRASLVIQSLLVE